MATWNKRFEKVKYMYMICICFIAYHSGAQNNGIFNGGFIDGVATEHFRMQSNEEIFSGQNGDGYGSGMFKMISQNLIFSGGIGDGLDLMTYQVTHGNPIFSGGQNDGVDLKEYVMTNQGLIFSGGSDDGYANEFAVMQNQNSVFAGGVGDGYDQSHISKLIWTGNISDDWLMAGNWNISRAPLSSDDVEIPRDRPHYPTLKDAFLVGYELVHNVNLTCHSIKVEKEAEFYGGEGFRMANFGRLHIDGFADLDVLEGFNIANLQDGVIEVGLSGTLIVRSDL